MLIKHTYKEYMLMTIISEQRKDDKPLELENRKVAERNDLISSVAKMDKTPLKIFEMAVSCIDALNPPKDNKVFLSKTELYHLLKVSDSNKHTRFKEAIVTLHKQAVFEIREMNDKKGKFEYRVISPIEETAWNDYSDTIHITFTNSIMPFLIDLGTKYTQYAITDIMELNSKYSIILYKWLSMHYNQFVYYSKKGERRKEQLEEYKNPTLKISDLRTMTDTIDEYSRFQSLETWIVKKPLEEISKHTQFNVTYEKLKKGRTIDGIQFHISKKEQPQELNGEYKEREQDPAYLKEKENRENKQKILFAEAMQSKYTKMLTDQDIIGFSDYANIEIMANLQEKVYPLYKELEEIVGILGVEKHISYVVDKQYGYSKRNTVKYLETAIKNYLPTAKSTKESLDKTLEKRKEHQEKKINKGISKNAETATKKPTKEELEELEKIKQSIIDKMKTK